MNNLFGEKIKYNVSTISDGPMNYLGHELYDAERRANRNQFLNRKCNIRSDEQVMPKLYHGARVEAVSKHNPIYGSLSCDALVTDVKGLALTMTFADCPTVFLYDPVAQAIGLIHAGWKPVTHDVIANTIIKMQQSYNTDPANLSARIGPGICENCWEVGPEVAIQFGYGVNNKVYLNLKDKIQDKLEEAGVKAANILTDIECTKCTTRGVDPKYYSWRRDHSDPLDCNMAVFLMVK